MNATDVESAIRTTTFLTGPPGAGKTSLGVSRLRYLAGVGIPGEQILVLVPHRALASPYYEAIWSPQFPAGHQIDVATIGGLARRSIELFWPLLRREAGFGTSPPQPRFLTLETAQYYMGQVVKPYLEAGAFDGVTISHARLASQAIDNLNKSAAVGFPVEDIAARLGRAWAGESARLRLFEQVQSAATAFRATCLAAGLLDWSLQIHLLTQHLLPLPQFRRYMLSGYRHLVADNVEEDIPATHDLLRLWLPLTESALVICDQEGGHRIFLGADPSGALALEQACRNRVTIRASHVASPAMVALARHLSGQPIGEKATPELARQALVLPPDSIRFHPQMLDWVALEIGRLISEKGVTPSEIAVLAPFVGDALRFSMEERMARYGVAIQTHRPSRQLREEPAVRCLLTLAKLAHPAWRRPPPPEDFAHALSQAIEGMDPVRAWLLAAHAYKRPEGKPRLVPFDHLSPVLQKRVSYVLGGRYTDLVDWLGQYALSVQPGSSAQTLRSQDEPLDHFLSRLFGEVLTLPGFGFDKDLLSGAAAAVLVESAHHFRQVAPGPNSGGLGPADPGLEYVDLVEQGVIAAQYTSNWQMRPEAKAILLMPAYTFLMMNRPVSFQFWLDAGSLAWHERIFQPLTHPYVLQRNWPDDATWTDGDEVRSRDAALARLELGLCHRCREKVYLAYCDLNERGHEQHGPLLLAVQRLLRHQEAPRP